jgi:hypothetical protein
MHIIEQMTIINYTDSINLKKLTYKDLFVFYFLYIYIEFVLTNFSYKLKNG